MNTNEIITELERGHRVFKAFEGALTAIEGLRNAEQVLNETNAATEIAKAKFAEHAKDLEEIKAEIAKRKVDGKSALEKANERLAEVNRQADEKMKVANKEIDEKLSRANEQVNAAKSEHKAIKDSTESAKAEYDALMKKIEAAKEQIKSLLA